jgi:hypothetical protein
MTSSENSYRRRELVPDDFKSVETLERWYFDNKAFSAEKIAKDSNWRWSDDALKSWFNSGTHAYLVSKTKAQDAQTWLGFIETKIGAMKKLDTLGLHEVTARFAGANPKLVVTPGGRIDLEVESMIVRLHSFVAMLNLNDKITAEEKCSHREQRPLTEELLRLVIAITPPAMGQRWHVVHSMSHGIKYRSPFAYLDWIVEDADEMELDRQKYTTWPGATNPPSAAATSTANTQAPEPETKKARKSQSEPESADRNKPDQPAARTVLTGKYCMRCHRDNHNTDEHISKQDAKCYICGQTGHKAIVCPKRPKAS